MSLDYSASYHCHCSITLAYGVSVTLKSLSQSMTYGGLLEGVPTARMNDRMLQGTIDEARQIPAMLGSAPFLVQPQRRDYLRSEGDME
jgi:hypothetical protein